MLFHCNWKLTLFVAMFLPLTISAGFWQLQRADQKQVMQRQLEDLKSQPAVDYLQLPLSERENYRNVSVSGTLMDAIFLLDNQIYKGQFGYEVIQLLALHNHQYLLVSRGWVEGDLDRRNLPDIVTPKHTLTLNAYLYQPTENIQLQPALLSEQWPRRVQTASLQHLQQQLIKPAVAEDYLLRLHSDSPAALISHWQLIPVRKEKHLGYAVQWFAMAVLLLGLFIRSSIHITKKENLLTTQ